MPNNIASHCRSCNRPIYWMKLHKREFCKFRLRMVSYEVLNAKPNPIDAEPHPKGKLVIDRANGRYRFATIDEIDTAERYGKKLYISHFETCPNATSHRS